MTELNDLGEETETFLSWVSRQEKLPGNEINFSLYGSSWLIFSAKITGEGYWVKSKTRWVYDQR